MKAALAMLVCGAAGSAGPPSGFPYTNEDLTYTVNWPSGLSLGEGRISARRAGQGWEFDLTLHASVPGYSVSDHYRSASGAALCSAEFHKEYAHGSRKARETVTFDSRRGTARRVTAGGGSSEMPAPACARDALAFLFFARRELGQGRVPPADTIFFGGPYSIRLEYTGAQTIPVHEKRVETDRLLATVKGKGGSSAFELFFARDPARTPLLIRMPFALGTFSMELVR